MQEGGADFGLISLLQDLNEAIDGSEQVVQMLRGARPGEAIADLLLFVCLTITKEARSILNRSEFRMSLPLSVSGLLPAQLGADTSTEDVDSVYADDAMHGFLRSNASLVVSAVGFTAQVFVARARVHRLDF